MRTSNTPGQLDPKSRIKGPGLTKPGVAILQTLFISIVVAIEILIRSNVGFLTGLSLWIAFAGGIYLGRDGTIFTSVVTPPLAFALSIIFLLPTVGGSTLRLSRFALDLVSGLASIAPFMVSGAVISWIIYFAKEAKKN
jgi:hypothetical protein